MGRCGPGDGALATMMSIQTARSEPTGDGHSFGKKSFALVVSPDRDRFPMWSVHPHQTSRSRTFLAVEEHVEVQVTWVVNHGVVSVTGTPTRRWTDPRCRP